MTDLGGSDNKPTNRNDAVEPCCTSTRAHVVVNGVMPELSTNVKHYVVARNVDALAPDSGSDNLRAKTPCLEISDAIWDEASRWAHNETTSSVYERDRVRKAFIAGVQSDVVERRVAEAKAEAVMQICYALEALRDKARTVERIDQTTKALRIARAHYPIPALASGQEGD